jgi:hypothetical protein
MPEDDEKVGVYHASSGCSSAHVRSGSVSMLSLSPMSTVVIVVSQAASG